VVEPDDVGTLALGRYRIVRRIAVGGMGDIFLARTEGDAGFVRPVVIKQVRPELVQDDAAVRMFEREARINARISHPNIVDVIDFRKERGAYLMVLEYVNGVSLSAWLSFHRHRDRIMSPEVAAFVAEQVLDALATVHGLVDVDGRPMPIIHRDISPSNILVSAAGHVKLMDFGIARLIEPNDPDEYATQTHAIKGKVSYLPPEVLEGFAATTRSDLYAAGVVLHEMLAGRNERRGGPIAEVLTRTLTQSLTPLAELRDDVPTELSALVERATAKDPELRPASAEAFRDALRGAVPVGGAADRVRAQLETDLAAPEMQAILGELHPTRLDRTWRDFGRDEGTELKLELSEEGSVGRVRSDTAPPSPAAAPRGRPATELPLETLAEQTARAQGLDPSAEPEPLPNHLARVTEGSTPELDWSPAGPPGESEARTRRVRRVGAKIAVATIVLLGLGVAGYGRLGSSRGTAPQPSPGALEPRVLMEVEPAEPAAPGNVEGAADPSRRARFEAQRATLSSCLKKHGLPARDLRDVRFDFQLFPGGGVEQVRLSPPELARTALGACLKRAARAMQLGAGQGARFSIVVSMGR
jgi:serine/threonine-protein kinase